MIHEISLFWVVVAAFLVADNFLLLPEGKDYLSIGRKGVFRYQPSRRFEARGRDLVFLNPLNLFDRALVTTSSLGPITASQFKSARRTVRAALPRLNALAAVGYLYLGAIVLLAAASFRFGFDLVLLTLIACHLIFWVLTTSMLVVWRQGLSLGKYQTFTFAAEALFVPAYIVNMGKRLWLKQSIDVPAMSLGLHQLRHMEDKSERELFIYEMSMRLDELTADLANVSPSESASDRRTAKSEEPTKVRAKAEDKADVHRWLKEARSCLKD